MISYKEQIHNYIINNKDEIVGILKELEKYNASGNFNLVSCEAHLSQLKEVLKIFHNDETEIAEKWADKIKELCEMPV